MSEQTPSQTVGPFFHGALLRGGEDVLVADDATNPRIRIRGRVLDGDGAPVSDALVEIWQADARGIYPHPGDPRHAEVDPGFRGFGRSGTDADGRYRFITVKPGRVAVEGQPGQAPHVNVRVFARGMLVHAVTRLYFADEAGNDEDPVLATVEPARLPTLIAALEATAGPPSYRFDICLQGESETVFFDP